MNSCSFLAQKCSHTLRYALMQEKQLETKQEFECYWSGDQ